MDSVYAVFLILGGFFTLIYIINGLYRSVRRQEGSTGDTEALVVMAFLTLGVVLIVDNLSGIADRNAVWDSVEWGVAIAAAALFLSGLVMMVLEWRRPIRLKGSRGLRGVFAGLLLLLLTIAAPTIATRVTLDDELATLPEATPGAEQTSMERAKAVFDQVVDVISAETGLDAETVATNLDTGVSVAEMVRQSEGDLEVVIQQITDILTEAVQQLAANGRMGEFEASLAISQMGNIVRIGVETDLTGALARFEETEESPEATAQPD